MTTYTCSRCKSNNTVLILNEIGDKNFIPVSDTYVNIVCNDCNEVGSTFYIHDDIPVFNIASVKNIRNFISDVVSKRVDEIDVYSLQVSFDNGKIWFSSFETDSLC